MDRKSKNFSEKQIIDNRKKKLEELKNADLAYQNNFSRTHLTVDILNEFSNETDNEVLATKTVTVAGRMMTKRVMGKASFAHVQDSTGRIQIYVTRSELDEEGYAFFKAHDLGDIIWIRGYLFFTNKGELSIHVTELRHVTKCLRPMPEKWHGLNDQEARYRQRYLDLIVNEKSKQTFVIRAKIIGFIRDFFTSQGFMEVETPMMHPIAGGANARPFITKHNSLNMELFLRIAPELYLKRLVVGGLEKVFEINRNFRNEGLSTKHNPEFTMLEFYQAYSNCDDLIDLTINLLHNLVISICGKQNIHYQNKEYVFDQNMLRLTMIDAIRKYCDLNKDVDLRDVKNLKNLANSQRVLINNSWGVGKIINEIFEKIVEPQLEQPIFITQYPSEVSPLARPNDRDPFFCDRFELFVAGREIANGFSELNDPNEQAERFKQQVLAKSEGDSEAMPYDEDYIKALEYGMPPTAGEGIGIDRLVMLLTDSPTIRDVLLYPQLRTLAD